MGQVERLLLSQNEPARRAQIEKVINDAAARVRHLSGVLGEWRLEEMSPAQTANLLGMLEQLQRRLRTSGELLQSWSDGFRAALGPEETQTLFWDLVDGAAGGEYSAHAFQRDQLAAIEQRVARRRVKSCVQQPNETEKLAHGVTRGIGKCATRGFRLRVYRAPHRGVPWGFMSSLLSSMDAARAQFAAQFSAQFSRRNSLRNSRRNSHPPIASTTGAPALALAALPRLPRPRAHAEGRPGPRLLVHRGSCRADARPAGGEPRAPRRGLPPLRPLAASDPRRPPPPVGPVHLHGPARHHPRPRSRRRGRRPPRPRWSRLRRRGAAARSSRRPRRRRRRTRRAMPRSSPTASE